MTRTGRVVWIARRSAGLSAIAGAIGLCCAGSANALVIDPIFDKSITSLTDAGQVEAAIDAAIATYDLSLKSNVTIDIDFSWGVIDGSSVASSDASESISYIYTGFTYAQVKADLQRAAAANPTDIALATAVANLPATSPTGLNDYAVTMAEAEALGLTSPNGGQIDGYVGFSSKLSYDLSTTGAAVAGAYQLESLAEHEIAEVMGRISGLSSSKPTLATPYDLFRYSAPGKPSFSYSSPAYFSIDGGKTDLANFNYTGGGDRGDWLTTATSTDAYDATASAGVDMGLSPADLTALDALGWDAANNPGGWVTANTAGTHGASEIGDVPEPAAWRLMILGVGLVGGGLRARRRATA